MSGVNGTTSSHARDNRSIDIVTAADYSQSKARNCYFMMIRTDVKRKPFLIVNTY